MANNQNILKMLVGSEYGFHSIFTTKNWLVNVLKLLNFKKNIFIFISNSKTLYLFNI
jgi:hypothetical protein